MPSPADADIVTYGSQSSLVRPPLAPEFPGCRPFRLTREDVDAYDGHFEYWDAHTETAWKVCEPTGRAHEQPSQRLAGQAHVVAAVRGAPIECYGTMDMILHDEGDRRRRILQADQVVYLNPGRARLPASAGLVIGVHDLPDVVVEVDHTTDVRRGKLGLYEAWGFPEVWVEVPDRTSPNRPAGRAPGLTVHLLADDRYRTTTVSRAFPGWTAAEIHKAMNEPLPSAVTTRVLERVGRALGARDGTAPDDTPWLRRQRAEGRAAGRAEGRARLLNVVIRRTLVSRGISVADDVTLDADDLAGLTDEDVMDALLECRDAADFRARLGNRRR